MRAFDVLTKAEVDIRASMQPRYHLEMALLRWIHLRKLVPLTDLIDQMQGGRAAVRSRRPVAKPKAGRPRRRPLSDGGRAGRRSARSRPRAAATVPAVTQGRARSVPAATQPRTLEPADIEGSLPRARSASRRSSSTAPSWRRRSGSTSSRSVSCSSTVRSIARCARSSSRIARGSRRPPASSPDAGCRSSPPRAPARTADVRVDGAAAARAKRPLPTARQRPEAAGARRLRRAGDARRLRGRDQGCRRNVVGLSPKPRPDEDHV